jgi:L-ascorbate metabolism protein UlaG (beta-lactamase superfamily)
MADNIVWYKQASFKVTGSKVVYFDPWGVDDHQQADLILVTHTHFDHFSPSDISHLRKEDTLVCVPIGADGVEGQVKIVKPGDTLEHKGMRIEVVPAYNMNKSFHAKGNLWVGYVVTLDRKKYYHAGDTDFIPEMKDLRDIDVAMVPVGGTYTMDAQEAAEAVNAFKPKLAIPMHWGDVVGSRADAEKFKQLSLCDVEILK